MATEVDRGQLNAWRRLGGLGLIGAVLALVLAAAVLVQGRQLALSEQALRSGDGYSVLSLYQVEIDYLRLAAQWHRSLSTDDPDLDTLQLRYDIWVSRVSLARTPSLARLMGDQPAYAATVAQLEAFVEHADRQLGGPGRRGSRDRDALLALLQPLEALGPAIHELTLAAAQRVAERADSGNRALRQQSQLGIALSVFLCALCAVFAGLSMRQTRRLQQRQQALEELTGHLREARREAESASEAKSVFLANMSHEIRTPFQGMLGMMALLRETGLNTRQVEFLRVATESADHLLAILNDILDLSQLESGRLTLSPAPLELPALLRQVEALMRPPATAKALALHFDADPGVPDRVIADGTRVKQVLFNLLSNAIKFSERGSITLDVRLEPGPPERLAFIVTDTGIGMDADARSRLFRRFSAGDPAPQRRQGGTGLGLEISRNLARMMGGELSVQSAPGEGSRFRFELPLERPTAPALSPALLDTRATGATRVLTVLVAEDHAVNRQYLSSLLEVLNHEAHFVPDGVEAVKAVQQRHFDLVLMDLHMPELDGIGATVKIRALPDRAAATVPIVALTADGFQETRDRCLLAGMNDFLTKPVSPQDLAAALRRLYGQEAADAAHAMAPAQPPPALGAGLIDHESVNAALKGLRPERLGELITQFLDDGPQTVAHLRAAVRDGEPLALRVHAHAARGAALNLGLAALAETAQALHEGAAHLPAHEVALLVQRFEELIPRTREAARAAGLGAEG
jgi:signal transduction histidine kinase/DNA-binding NarL/FixJ family response regulator